MGAGGGVRSRVRRFARGALTTALLAGSLLPAQSAGVEPDEAETVSVLVVGDSITHGSTGDYTWRYFAWQHLAALEAEVDLVGPSRAVFPAPGARGRAQYADPAFDRDHAAAWGDRIVYEPLHDRAALVATYTPDVVVLGLGTNDLLLGWRVRTVVKAVRSWVEDTRAEAPGTGFVLLEVPGSTTPRAAKFNRRLRRLATRLDTPDAAVTVARTSVGFRSGRGHRRTADTHDPRHPNARGQVKIAGAVVDALARIGVGEAYARPLRFVPEPPRVRPVVRARRVGGGVRLRWTMPAGATSADAWMRAPGEAWIRVARAHPGTAWRVRGLAARHPHGCRSYAFRVRVRKGWTLAGRDMASRVRRVRIGGQCQA